MCININLKKKVRASIIIIAYGAKIATFYIIKSLSDQTCIIILSAFEKYEALIPRWKYSHNGIRISKPTYAIDKLV